MYMYPETVYAGTPEIYRYNCSIEYTVPVRYSQVTCRDSRYELFGGYEWMPKDVQSITNKHSDMNEPSAIF